MADAEIMYDPATGNLWRRAGTVANNGYRQINFDGKLRLEHRVAWFMHYGVWPKGSIDHINGIKTDNRIANLREVSASENMRNRGKPRDNTSGHKGVSWNKASAKWQAAINFEGRNYNLGRFDDLGEAADAYNKAALKYHGKFAVLDL